MDKKKRLIIIISLALVTFLLVTFLASMFLGKNKKEPDSINDGSYSADEDRPEDKENDTKDEEVDNEDATDDNEVSHEKELVEGGEYLGDNSSTMELSESTAKLLLRDARLKMSEFEFEEAERIIAEGVAGFNLNKNDNYKKYLKDFHEELPIITFLDEMEEYKDFNGIRNTLDGIKDKESFLTAIMSLRAKTRVGLIPLGDSINPSFDGRMNIKSMEEVDYSNIKEISTINGRVDNLKSVTKADIVVEGNELVAYIASDNEKHILYGIFEKEKGSTYYITNDEWKEVFGSGGTLGDE